MFNGKTGFATSMMTGTKDLVMNVMEQEVQQAVQVEHLVLTGD
jgi:hypothetical protein